MFEEIPQRNLEMGVSFYISRQGKRYMPNDAVYVRVCPCLRLCVYVWMRAKVNLAESNQVIHKKNPLKSHSYLNNCFSFSFLFLFLWFEKLINPLSAVSYRI